MKLEEKTLRMGAAAVLIAVVLRIFAAADFGYLFSGDGFVSVMTFLGTGRWVQNVQLPETQIPSFIPEEPVQAVFSLQELNAISLHNPNGYTADLQSALCTPLGWQLANGQPAVLILHSHASEAFPTAPAGALRTRHTIWYPLVTGWGRFWNKPVFRSSMTGLFTILPPMMPLMIKAVHPSKAT